MARQILLSFDVEEFDIPEEYGEKVKDKEKFGISERGLREVLSILDKKGARATFFVTASFAQKHKNLIKEMAKKHEIASHGYYHSSFFPGDLAKSKKVLEKIAGKKILGFRMPRLKKLDSKKVREAGYSYDSSLNPIYLPGRYKNFFSKRRFHYKDELLIIPASATPIVRFPLFWLSFKNFPEIIYRIASDLTLRYDGYVNIYLHPWEFVDIKKFKVPWYVKRRSGARMKKKLERHLKWLEKKGDFITFSEFYNLVRKQDRQS